MNAFLADHAGSSLSLEYAVLDLQNPGYEPEPWTPVDSLAWLKAMAWNLSGNLDAEIQRVVYATYLSDSQIADLDPPYPYDRAPVIVTDSSDMTAVGPALSAHRRPTSISRVSRRDSRRSRRPPRACPALRTGRHGGHRSNSLSWTAANHHREAHPGQ